MMTVSFLTTTGRKSSGAKKVLSALSRSGAGLVATAPAHSLRRDILFFPRKGNRSEIPRVSIKLQTGGVRVQKGKGGGGGWGGETALMGSDDRSSPLGSNGNRDVTSEMSVERKARDGRVREADSPPIIQHNERRPKEIRRREKLPPVLS